MSKKLTKKMLDALIKEAMLQEDIQVNNIPNDLKKEPKNNYKDPIKAKVKKLSQNDGVDTDISVNDINQAVVNNDPDEMDALKFLAQGLKTSSVSGKQFTKDFATASGKVGKSKIQTQDKPQSVFQFDISNAGMQDSTPTMGPALKNVFDTIGLYDETLYGRIEKISIFSNTLIEAAEGGTTAADLLKRAGLLKFTRYVMVLDYLNTIAKNVDAGAGAYLFETFLAALAGGNVAGKETTATGQMGGADFTFGNNPLARGSSKYLKGSSKATQSPKGFEKKEYIHYVIAKKVLDAAGGKESSMDIDQILGFDIYYPVVAVVEPKKKFQFYKVKNKEIEKSGSVFSTTDTFEIPATSEYYISTLKLVTVKGEKFRDVLDKALKEVGGDFEAAFREFQTAFDSVAQAKESVGVYSTSGKQADGDKAITDLVAYKTALKAVFEKLATLDPAGSEYEAPTDTSALSENKMKQLDLMIEHMVKQFIKGNLND